jgi:hypothetical protein
MADDTLTTDVCMMAVDSHGGIKTGTITLEQYKKLRATDADAVHVVQREHTRHAPSGGGHDA